jgi:Tol biopolymer transport system component
VPEIYLKPVNGSTITRLTNSTYAEIQPCFSPDGKSFAYATNRRGNWDICLEQIEGGKNPRWLTLDMPKTDEISPSFHPGGKWLAFSTFNQRVGQWEIAVKNIETGQVRYLGEGLYPRFSPRGDRIAFQRARSREPRWYSIWVIEVDEDLNTRNPTEVVSSAKWAAINPAWSPDGKYLAFATVHESPLAQSTTRILMGDDIWVVNIEGQDLVKITDTEAPESHPVWGRDDKGRDRIFFCSMMKGPKNIWSLQPIMPEPFGSVSGPLPGPKPRNAPPEKAPPANSGAGPESALRGYLAPPPPAMTAPGTGSN